MTDPPRQDWLHPFWAPLHVAALTCLGVSQPILDLVARHPEFIAATGLRGLRLAVFGLAVAWLPPLALSFPAALALRGRNPGVLARLVACAALFVAFVVNGLGLASRATSATLPAATACLVFAFLGLALYRWLGGFRFLVSVLAVSLLVAPGVFFASKGVADRFVQRDAGPAPPVANPQPVFMLLFDEFPGWLSMTPDFQVDAQRFPNLAALAAVSDYFPMAFSSAKATNPSVPSLLSGVHVRSSESPRAMTCNFLPKLSTSYELTINELVTDFAPPTSASLDAERGAAAIARDLFWIYLHWLLPDSATAALPPIDVQWTGFGTDPELDLTAMPQGPGDHVEVTDVTVPRFGRFLRSLRPPQAGVVPFVFHHCNVPHAPWRLLPSGQTYALDSPRAERESYYADEWWALEGRARKELNSRAVDQLVRRFVERLQATDQFDSAWILVMSDHGTAFAPGFAARSREYQHLPIVLSVPLLVKRPGQTQGRRFDRYVELVDVAATLSEELGFELPCNTDGRNLYGSPERTYGESVFANVFGYREGSLEDVEATLRAESLRHRVLLGLESRNDESITAAEDTAAEGIARQARWTANGPYGLGPFGSLLGDEVPEEAPSLPYLVELEGPDLDVVVDPDAALIPARIFGRLHGVPAGEHVDLALAVGGRIVSTTRSRELLADEFFSGMVDPALLEPGPFDFQAFALSGTAERPEFHLLESIGKNGMAERMVAASGEPILQQGGVYGFDRLLGSSDVDIKGSGSELSLVATSLNPVLYFELDAFEAKELVVEIDVTVPRGTEVQVWYQTENLPNYSLQQIRRALVDEGRSRVVLRVTADSALGREIRIDPGFGFGPYVIHSLTVRPSSPSGDQSR